MPETSFNLITAGQPPAKYINMPKIYYIKLWKCHIHFCHISRQSI